MIFFGGYRNTYGQQGTGQYYCREKLMMLVRGGGSF